MDKIKVTNVRAGNIVKLPGGRRLRKGETASVPSSLLVHSSIRKLISTGRMRVNNAAEAAEARTDSLIHKARNAVDNLIDIPEIEEATDQLLDKAEDLVEGAVDAVIDGAKDAVNGLLDSVTDMLGISEEEKQVKPEPEPEPAPKPKRRRRSKKTTEEK